MTTYRYKASRIGGKSVTGQIVAATSDEAARALRERGLTDVDVQPVTAEEQGSQNSPEEQDIRVRPLSAPAAEIVFGHVAYLSQANLPLAPGLRAAAEESGNDQIAMALRCIATQLDQGMSLEGAMASDMCPLPAYMRQLVAAAARTGQLGSALDEIVEYQRGKRRMQRGIVAAFAYPVVVACLSLTLLILMFVFIGGIFHKMFEDFGLSLPKITQLLFWYREYGIWFGVGLVMFVMAIVLLLRLVLSRERWLRLLATTPIFGTLWCWAGFADWCNLMAMLARFRIPLPEALRLASDGIANRYVASISQQLADGVAQGQTLALVLGQVPHFPASVVPVLRWGETSDALHGALEASRDLFSQRVRSRVLMLQSVLPPMMFISIACGVLFLIGALFIPLVSLISGLS